jgi:hypothetical protein
MAFGCAGPSTPAVRTWVVAALAVAAGCGLRSDPTFVGESLTDVLSDGASAEGGVVDPDRMGACNSPFDLPPEPTTIQGTLPDHGSLYGGWCGRDAGPEDVYRFVPAADTDVTIVFRRDLTDFEPTLRVQSEACGGSTTAIDICAVEPFEDDFHFFALAGSTYFISVDSSEAGIGGNYGFDVLYGDPGLERCPVHPEVIVQSAGAAFVWGNDFARGQGRVDGRCGGPGRENMFRLDISYSAPFSVRVEGTEGFEPVVNLRTSCGGLTEILCAKSGDTGTPGVAEIFLGPAAPGTYYIVVDQVGIEGGPYSLRVDFQ